MQVTVEPFQHIWVAPTDTVSSERYEAHIKMHGIDAVHGN